SALPLHAALPIYAGGVLPTVLQHHQAIVELRCDVVLGDDSDDAAHGRMSCFWVAVVKRLQAPAGTGSGAISAGPRRSPERSSSAATQSGKRLASHWAPGTNTGSRRDSCQAGSRGSSLSPGGTTSRRRVRPPRTGPS